MATDKKTEVENKLYAYAYAYFMADQTIIIRDDLSKETRARQLADAFVSKTILLNPNESSKAKTLIDKAIVDLENSTKEDMSFIKVVVPDDPND